MNPFRNRTELILAGLAALLVLSIAAGTVWAFASGRAHPGTNAGGGSRGRSMYGRETPKPDPDGKTAIFGDIGVLRAKTADAEPVTVVVSPFMPYPSDDIAFREELVQKTRTLRASMLGWFASHTFSEINKLGEDGVKRELIAVINANLVLGRIETVYFDEFMVLG